jgi:amphi-Trp domain-containing protein
VANAWFPDKRSHDPAGITGEFIFDHVQIAARPSSFLHNRVVNIRTRPHAGWPRHAHKGGNVANKLFKYDGLQDPDTIAAYLEAIRDGFANGSITLTQGEQSLQLSPKGLVAVTVEGKLKGEDRKLKLTFRWKERDEACEAIDAPLLITARDPSDA